MDRSIMESMERNDLTEQLLGREITIRFVSIMQAVRLHDASIDRVGGTAGVRDLTLLDSALHRPMLKALYEDESDPVVLAAVLADGIVQNHAFLDGNKRTGFLCCVEMLERNGIPFQPDVSDTVDCFRRLANHEMDVDGLVQWIREELSQQEWLRQQLAQQDGEAAGEGVPRLRQR